MLSLAKYKKKPPPEDLLQKQCWFVFKKTIETKEQYYIHITYYIYFRYLVWYFKIFCDP